MNSISLKDTICAVCYERYNDTAKIPILLVPCGHTFCKECLESIVITKRKVICPLDRSPSSLSLKDLPKNILLCNILQEIYTAQPFYGVKSFDTPLTQHIEDVDVYVKDKIEDSKTKEEMINKLQIISTRIDYIWQHSKFSFASISNDDLMMVRNWIPLKLTSINLAYKASMDGYNASAFHKLCDGQGPSIFIVFTTIGSIIGGFTSFPVTSKVGYVKDPHSFVFSVTNKTMHPVQKSHVENALYWEPNQGPKFGVLGDIYIKFQKTEKYITNLGSSYTLPKGIKKNTDEARKYLTGFKTYSIRDVEVYTLS